MAKIKEVDLAEAVISWLEAEHWDVYQEVQIYTYSSRCDIIATKGFLVWAIECKLNLTWGVIEQARHWHTHFRSIAVPMSKTKNTGRGTAYHVCHKFYKIGIIEVMEIDYHPEFKYEVREARNAPLLRENHESAKRIKAHLRPEHKTHAKAGTSARGGFFTPYKDTMYRVKRFITENPGCTLKEVMDDTGKGHYASYKSARSSIRNALFDIESGWCRVDTDSKPWRYYLRENDNHALG